MKFYIEFWKNSGLGFSSKTNIFKLVGLITILTSVWTVKYVKTIEYHGHKKKYP